MPEPRGAGDLTPPGAPVEAYVALGSNLGEREARVLAAVRAIEAAGGGRIRALSPLYETPAEGPDAGGPYVNAVAKLQTLLPPGDLLERLQDIEKRMGRTGGHGRPREIDLDLVAYGDRVVASDGLVLPHPRYARRAFVLVPLRDVAPSFACPSTGAGIDAMIEALGTARDVRPVGRRGYVAVAP